VKALRRKLFRDLCRLRYQAFTIALLVGCGIASLVAAVSASASVQASRDAFYVAARFADVFVHFKSGPRTLVSRLRELPGVATVEGRVTGDFRLVMSPGADPVLAHFVSIRWPEDSQLNQVWISSGRQVGPGALDEVVLSSRLAETWGIGVGASISAVIEGRLAKLRVVGLGVSPEFVWASEPRTGIPDSWHYGVAWMDGRALAQAMGLEGAINDATLQLAAGADEAETIRRLDALLEPYGGLGAIGRDDQASAKLVDQKVEQLKRMARTLPLIFLLVAGFLLHVLLSRIVGTQREQIATLKALGYRTRELTRHYVELALVICAMGTVFGWGLGLVSAKGILSVYAQYFRFPAYLFRFNARAILAATVVSLLGGILGTLSAVRKAVSVPPAEAMRPEAPAIYRRTLFDRLYTVVAPVARMVLRELQRRPWRLLLSAGSISLATAIVVAGNAMTDSIDNVLRVAFEVSHHEAINVTLDPPSEWRAVGDAAHIPGVLRAEGERQVPVRLIAGPRSKTTAILGLAPNLDLHRLLSANLRPISLPPNGLSLSRVLGNELGVHEGDMLDVEVLEGKRQRARIPVALLVDDLLGLTAYMDATELKHLLDEPSMANILLLEVDPSDIDAVSQRLVDIPKAATVHRPAVDRALVRAQVTDVFLVLEGVLAIFASAIAVGVVYNNARIALEVRSRDLATLRILGFTRGELAAVLLGEQGIQVGLGIIPGLLLGKVLGSLTLGTIDRELLRVPIVVSSQSYLASGFIVLCAALVSALLVQAQADRLDLVAVLKARD
jgi:putative ABC transport system permease protein